MGIAWSDVVDFVTGYSGKIMFLAGAVLTACGALTFNLFGTIASAVSIFLGILFAVFGLFVLLGVFSARFRSLNGISIIMICTSIVCFAFSIVSLQFLSTKIVDLDPMYHRMRFLGFLVTFQWERPYLWASGIFALLGLASLITGIVLKVYYVLKS